MKWFKNNGFRFCIFVGVVLLVLFLRTNIAIGGSGGGGGCVAIVFDKASVMGADRIVIREDGKEITVTDAEMVSAIASEFVVANKTALCDYTDRQIDIYNGDKLVRCVYWNSCCDLATIYDADVLHWIIPPEGKTGQVELSREFKDMVDRIVEEYGE